MLLFDKIYPRKLVNCFPVLLLLFLVFGLWGNRMHIQTSLYDEIYFKNLFILRALPFFLAGMWLRKNHDTVKAWTISEKNLIIAIFFGSLLSLGERKFFVESQFYLGTYIVAGAMMIYAMINICGKRIVDVCLHYTYSNRPYGKYCGNENWD